MGSFQDSMRIRNLLCKMSKMRGNSTCPSPRISISMFYCIFLAVLVILVVGIESYIATRGEKKRKRHMYSKTFKRWSTEEEKVCKRKERSNYFQTS